MNCYGSEEILVSLSVRNTFRVSSLELLVVGIEMSMTLYRINIVKDVHFVYRSGLHIFYGLPANSFKSKYEILEDYVFMLSPSLKSLINYLTLLQDVDLCNRS